MNGLVILESKRKAINLERALKQTSDGIHWSCHFTGGQLIDIEPKSVSSTAAGISVQVDYTVRFSQFAKTIKEAIPLNDVIVIATDPDREGERIALDITRYFQTQLKDKDVRRIDLREMTVDGFMSAMEHSRPIDLSLAHAAKIRAVIDKYIGYSLSSLAGVSLGRVQTPLLAEINRQSNTRNIIFTPCADGSIEAPVVDIKKIPSPIHPLSTWDILKIMASESEINPNITMKAAQALYADGLISYPRTDAVCLSKYASTRWLNQNSTYCENLSSILENLNELDKHNTSPYRIEGKGAHEALHTLQKLNPSRDAIERKIWSIINDALVKTFNSQGITPLVQTTFRIDTADGAYNSCVIEPTSRWAVGELVKGDVLIKAGIDMEGAIAAMESNGLGRPSTAADIINSLFEKRYISNDRNYLSVTEIGAASLDAASKIAPILLSPKFTANMEKELAKLAAHQPEDAAGRNAIEQEILKASFNLVKSAEQKAKEHSLAMRNSIIQRSQPTVGRDSPSKTFRGRPILDDICSSEVTVEFA